MEKELNKQKMLTTKEFCALWHISKPTLTQWIREGLPHVQIQKSGAFRISKEEAEAWLRKKTQYIKEESEKSDGT